MENLARQKNNKNKENRLIASGAATISFLPNLKLKSSVALDRRNGVSTTFLDPISPPTDATASVQLPTTET